MPIKKCQNCYRVVGLFWNDDIFEKPRTKMTTVTCCSRQHDAGLRAITVVLRENFVLVVVLVQESKALYYRVHCIVNSTHGHQTTACCPNYLNWLPQCFKNSFSAFLASLKNTYLFGCSKKISAVEKKF